MKTKTILFLFLLFAGVLVWAGSYPASADCTSCMQECNNLNANAPEIPTDCDEYCSSQCSGGSDCSSAVGSCKSQCESWEVEETESDCPSGQMCCVSSGNDCYSLDGSCESSCGSDEIEETQSDCPGEQICCVADSGGTHPPGDPVIGGAKCSGDFKKIAGVCFPSNTGLAETPIATILRNALFWLLGIFGFIGIAGFVISGIQYLVSAGNEKGIETAKRNMKWSLVGVVVGISGMVIIRAITAALEATTSSF